MTAFFGFFVSQIFPGLLGVTSLSMLVWYIGPLLAFAGVEPLQSEGRRWWLIALLFALWLLYLIVAAIRQRLRNRRLMEQLDAGPEPPADPAKAASAEELQTLRERFEQALATLKQSEGRRGFGGRWVYQLPWYLIIGPPGCGKTTALLNSGLRFPLAERLGQDAIHGIGGTRNCDWWFTEDGVLIDTAGRYTTQDSYQEVDKAAWTSFLELLKKHRPRRPINGVLVAVSLSDLIQQGEAERAAHAQAIRQRVQELCQTFRIAVPVYVLFMKADLIAGFSEFFADLGKEEREQVWGTTFPLDTQAPPVSPSAAFAAEMKMLHERLDQRLLTRLEQEREPGKRNLVFCFPRQFGALAEVLEHFLDQTFAPSRYAIHPLVRGVYFTSGTQTGTPIDRILSSFAAGFGLGRQGILPFKGTGKSYFLTRLLRDVVFPESGLAGLDLRLERRRLWLRRGAYAGVAGLALLAALAWFTSYARNQSYIDSVAQRVQQIASGIDALSPQDRNPLGVLPLLDAARTIPHGYAERQEGVPLTMGFGLYQGGKLGPQAERAYLQILRKALLPRIILRLEEQIRQSSSNPQYLYDALRIYLMLGSDEHYDAAAIQLWVGRDWQRSLPRETTTEQQESLLRHLAALLEQRPTPLPLDLDGALIADARAILGSASLADRVYDRLKSEGVGRDIPDFTISNAAGDFAKLVFVRRSGQALNQGVPALYTYDGYHRGFAKAIARLVGSIDADSWVLGPGAELKPGSDAARQLFAQVRERYLRDYVAQWQGILDDLDLVSVSDLQHAAEVARILADPADSPLRRLLLAVATQTELDRAPANQPAPEAKADVADDFRQRVERYFGEDSQPAAAAGEPPEAYVTQRFRWLHELVRAHAPGQAPIDQALAAVGKLQLQLSTVAAAVASGRGQLVAGQSAEIQEAKAVASRLPGPVKNLIGSLAQDSATLSAGGVRAQLNAIWTTEVLPFCREAISDRYPFVRGSTRETTLVDFGRLFGPDGLIDAFFKARLATIVDTAAARWRWTDNSIGIPTDVLAQFQRAAAIREAYFMAGGKTPAVEFGLQPVSMDARVTQFTLDLGGQILDYRQGPPRGQKMKWPAPEGIDRVRMSFADETGAGPSLTEDGPWAWFRLLDRSSMKPTSQQERFLVTFALGGLAANFELRAVSVRNPFRLDEVRGFSCPGRL